MWTNIWYAPIYRRTHPLRFPSSLVLQISLSFFIFFYLFLHKMWHCRFSVLSDLFHQDGYTALHAAARQGHENLVRYLVDVGANIDARDQAVGFIGTDILAIWMCACNIEVLRISLYAFYIYINLTLRPHLLSVNEYMCVACYYTVVHGDPCRAPKCRPYSDWEGC
jgi:hypothetical protein